MDAKVRSVLASQRVKTRDHKAAQTQPLLEKLIRTQKNLRLRNVPKYESHLQYATSLMKAAASYLLI